MEMAPFRIYSYCLDGRSKRLLLDQRTLQRENAVWVRCPIGVHGSQMLRLNDGNVQMRRASTKIINRQKAISGMMSKGKAK